MGEGSGVRGPRTTIMDVRVSTKVNRPAWEVFDYISDPTNDPVWISGITSAQLLTDLPVGRGTRVKRVAKFLGRTINYVLEISDYQSGALISMRSVQVPFPMEVDYRLRPAGDATESEIRVGGGTGGFYRLATPLMEAQVRRSLKKDAASIKAILER
jgi:uncharacterized membrane protein